LTQTRNDTVSMNG